MKRLIICKECNRQKKHHAKGLCGKCYQHDYYIAHKEKILTKRRHYRETHTEERREYGRQYYATHLEKMRAVKRRSQYRTNKMCPDCGTQISDRATYCRRCSKIGKRNPAFGKMYGSDNPRWSGGRTICEGGYIRILKPDHPYANGRGYVLEHRLVVENAIGRYLGPEESVHHINGKKDDNRLENLELIDHHKRRICPQCGWPMNDLMLAGRELPCES